jgi:hypothetical protein
MNDRKFFGWVLVIAVNLLRQTADAEDILGKHPVSPGALVPVREQLGALC